MGLSSEALAGLKALGYEMATPVQASVFGPAMSGRDLMVQSKTGTGKTTAFGLPLIERVRMEQGVDPQALVLCPTRELAVQVSEELAELGDPKGVRVLPIYGGQPMGPQLRSLKAGCDVVVGTPGRVLDHIRRRTLRLVHVHLAVLDEADEMLSMGFWDEVTAILDQLPAQRQTFLFSATLPDQIRKTARAYMKDPALVDISRDELTVEGIRNIAYESDDRLPKPRNLLYILEVERPENAVIFCNTRDDASVLAAFLRRQGLHALALSGELSQKDREKVMRRMKLGELKYLVATDIAARGIDISDLSHVICYSLPEFTEVYLHRIGRTGRIGKKGVAVALVSGRDEITFSQLQREFHIKFEKKQLPEFAEIMKLQAARVAGDLLKTARETEITAFLPLAEHLKATEAGTEVTAFLLKSYFSQLEAERARMPTELGGESRDEEPAAEEGASEPRGRGRDRDRPRDRDRGRDRDRPRDRDRGRDRAREPERERPRTEDAAAQAQAPSQEEPGADAPSAEVEGARSRDGDGREERDGRRRRRRRGPGEGEGERSDAPPMPEDWIRLFVNRGGSDGYDDGKVQQLLLELAGSEDAAQVGRIQLRRTHTFVEVAPALGEAAVAAAGRGVEREDKPVTVERARTR
jgi:ATP-dependent RNA helicase DeaD